MSPSGWDCPRCTISIGSPQPSLIGPGYRLTAGAVFDPPRSGLGNLGPERCPFKRKTCTFKPVWTVNHTLRASMGGEAFIGGRLPPHTGSMFRKEFIH